MKYITSTYYVALTSLDVIDTMMLDSVEHTF